MILNGLKTCMNSPKMEDGEECLMDVSLVQLQKAFAMIFHCPHIKFVILS